MKKIAEYWRRFGSRALLHLARDYFIFSLAYLKNTKLNSSIKFSKRLFHILTLRQHVHWFDGFSSAWHADTFQNRAHSRRLPLVDYLHSAKGWFPMSEFDSWYLLFRPDVVEYPRPPLIHFLKYESRTSAEVKNYYEKVLENKAISHIPSTTIFIPGIILENLPEKILINIDKLANLNFMYDAKMYYRNGPSFKVIRQSALEEPNNSKMKFDLALEDSQLSISIRDSNISVINLQFLLALISQTDWSNSENFKDLLRTASIRLESNLSYQKHLMKLEGCDFNTETTESKQIQNFVLKSQKRLGRVKSIEYINTRNSFDPPKRILLVSHEDKRSGSPLFLKRIAEILNENHIETKIVIYSGIEPDHIFESLGTDYEFLDWRMQRRGLAGPSNTNWLLSPNGRSAFIDIVNDFRPDVVLLNSLATADLAAPLSSLNIPFLNYVHENWANNYNLQHSNDPFVLSIKFALERSILNLFGSNNSRVAWSSLFEMHRSEVLHSINSITEETSSSAIAPVSSLKNDFGIGENTMVYLAISVFEPRKRIEDIIISFKTANLSDAKLIIIGRCNRFPDYERMLDELIQNDSRIFVCQSTGNLQPYFDLATVFVHASQEEVFPLILQEAIANSLPIICSKYNGYEELLGMDYQFTFLVGNHAELSALILNSRFTLTEMLAQVIQLRDRFVIEKSNFDKALLAYLEVLNGQLIFSSKEV